MKSGFAVFIIGKCRFVRLAEDPRKIEIFSSMITAKEVAHLVGEPTKIVPVGFGEMISVLKH